MNGRQRFSNPAFYRLPLDSKQVSPFPAIHQLIRAQFILVPVDLPAPRSPDWLVSLASAGVTLNGQIVEAKSMQLRIHIENNRVYWSRSSQGSDLPYATNRPSGYPGALCVTSAAYYASPRHPSPCYHHVRTTVEVNITHSQRIAGQPCTCLIWYQQIDSDRFDDAAWHLNFPVQEPRLVSPCHGLGTPFRSYLKPTRDSRLGTTSLRRSHCLVYGCTFLGTVGPPD